MTQAAAAARVLPYSRQTIEDDDVAAVVSVLRSDWLTQGPKIGEFEARMAEYCGVSYAVAFNTGTAALHAAVYAAGIGPGDEVLTSPLSFAASANCALYQGATPRFVDVNPSDGLIDPAGVAAALTKKVKAVIPVDFAGHPADLDPIIAAARKRGAVVIQDASHSLGARYKGRRIGSQCDLTTLSFHPVKPITTGEGGMVLTGRKDLFERLSLFRTHGIVKPTGKRQAQAGPWFYEMVDLGFNYRLTDMQCALGLSQLKKIERFLARRREIAATYDKAFAGQKHLKPLPVKANVSHAYHLYPVTIDFKALGKSRIQVMDELRARGVGSQVHYIPIPSHPYYRKKFGYKPGDFPNAEKMYERLLSLPIYPTMSADDVKRVVTAVAEVL